MRFHYSGTHDNLTISFQPGKHQKATKSHEVVPNIHMGFDKKGRLLNIEVSSVSQQQPGLDVMVEDMVKHIAEQSDEMSKEALLSIEKTIRLDVGDVEPPHYQPHFYFDAPANLLRIELLHGIPADSRLPVQQILEHTFASFTVQGQLIDLEITAALQQFPDLHAFIQQGQELQSLQQFFQFPPPAQT